MLYEQCSTAGRALKSKDSLKTNSLKSSIEMQEDQRREKEDGFASLKTTSLKESLSLENLDPRLFSEKTTLGIWITRYHKELYKRLIAPDRRLREAFKLAIQALIEAFARGSPIQIQSPTHIINLNLNINQNKVYVVPEYVLRFVEKIAKGGGGILQQPPRWARDEARKILDRLRREGLLN